MNNCSFSQDYNHDHHSDRNNQNLDYYLNPIIDIQVLNQVGENEIKSKKQLKIRNITKKQKKKLKINFSKRKKIELQNSKQRHKSIKVRKDNKKSVEDSKYLFYQYSNQQNEFISSTIDRPSKITMISSIKWKFDFIATLMKQTKLEMIQLQQHRNDKQLL